MMNKESICRNCFHSYVCEQFNENKDDNNTKCHFANDHYIPTADVVPRAEVEALEREIARLKKSALPSYCQAISEDEALKIGKENGKQEVAREIFGEIEKLLEYGFSSCHINGTEEHFDFYRADLGFQIAELKKKYTEDNHTEHGTRLANMEVELKALRGAANSYKMHYAKLAREIFEVIELLISRYRYDEWYTVPDLASDVELLKMKYTGEGGE